MTPQKGKPVISATQSTFEQVSLTNLSPELARQNFHSLEGDAPCVVVKNEVR